MKFLFSSKTHISTSFAQDIYDLLFTNANIFSWRRWGQKHFNQFLIEFFLLAATRKNETKLRKTEQSWKKNKTNESVVKMRYQIQILWGLLNLNEMQTSEILTVIAVIGRRYRSSRLEVFCSWFRRKHILRNFAKFTGKHLCQSVFLNKSSDLLRNFQEHLFLKNTSGGCFCSFLNIK